MSDTIFQVTDLTSKRVEFVEAARLDRARLRDKDGTSFLMLRESQVNVLEQLAEWNAAYLRLERLVARGTTLTVSDLGDLAWLRAFDHDDLLAFVEDLHDALLAAAADQNFRAVASTVNDWRVTAAQLDDPLRRSVLVDNRVQLDDLAETLRPE